MNGSSLPNSSGLPVAAALAARAWVRWMASSIIRGVAEVGFFLAIAGADAAVALEGGQPGEHRTGIGVSQRRALAASADQLDVAQQ